MYVKENHMHLFRSFSIVSVLVAAAVFATSCRERVETTETSDTTIAVIPKGTTHVFWKSVESGAREAGKEFDLNIRWKGPMVENDRAGQIALVQQALADGVKGIILAPLDKDMLVDVVKSVKEKNIPVVIMDSAIEGIPGVDFASYVATDNYQGGKIAGEYMVKLLEGKGKVVLMRYIEGSASTMQREQGFLDAMNGTPGMTVISQDQYGGATSSLAKDRAMNMMDTIREADGIFCPNEGTTLGMLLALQATSLAGKKMFVGFDASDVLVKALIQGEIMGLVAQNPNKMGYTAVKTMAEKLKGLEVEPSIDTGCALITRGNIDENTPQETLKGNK